MTWQCFTSIKYNEISRKIIAVEGSSSPYVFKELNLYDKYRKKVSKQHLLTSGLNKGFTNIADSQDSRERGKRSLLLLTTTSTRFTGT